jgi:hypothetical protein
MQDLAFYRARAEEAELLANTTNLERVRAQWLCAAKAWTAMAERVEETERQRKMNLRSAINGQTEARPGSCESDTYASPVASRRAAIGNITVSRAGTSPSRSGE